MKIVEVCSKEQGWLHILYGSIVDGSDEYISIKIGQYTHTRNYDLEDISHNKNLATDTLEIMGFGKNISSVFSRDKYKEWSEDCGTNHVLLSWFPARLLPTLLKEVELCGEEEECEN